MKILRVISRFRPLKSFAAVLLLLLAASYAHAQRTALKTNALYWATATPNVAVETQLGRKWTADLSLGYNPFSWKDNKKWKHVAVQPELRYWLCAPYAGHFLAANLLYTHYNAGGVKLPFGIWPGLEDGRFQGDLGAVGVGYGYSWLLSNRLSLEAEATVGYGFTRYKEYDCQTCGSFRGTKNKHLFMPTRLAVTLVYFLR